MDPKLQKVVDSINSGTFGDPETFDCILDSLHVDWYLISNDFGSYLDAQNLIDEDYRDTDKWTEKTIKAVSRMGFFSSDRSINEYAESIWSIEPIDVPSA